MLEGTNAIGRNSIIGDNFDAAVWPLALFCQTQKRKKKNAAKPDFTATGFLFARNVGTRRIFLVSNKHVFLEDAPHSLDIYLPSVYVNGEYCRPRIPLYSGNLQTFVRSHPSVDLAVIDVTDKIEELQNSYPDFAIEPIEDSQILFSWDIPRQTPCDYLGYPDNSPDPRAKRGYLGRNPQKLQTSNIPLEDVSIAQGASGSPAFVAVGRDPRLLGIVFGTKSTQITSGHEEFDYGFVVKVTELMAVTNALLRAKGLM